MNNKVILITVFLILVSFSVSAQITPDLNEKLNEIGEQERTEVLIQVGPSMTDQHIENLEEIGEVRNRYQHFNGVHLELPRPAVENLANRPFVESIEPNYEISTTLSESATQIQAQEAWKFETTGHGVDVAILDTGIQATHPELDVAEEVDFTGEGTEDLDGHGTHVAGIVGSQHEENRGIAYESTLYDVKVLTQDGTGQGSDLLQGMEWAIENNMQVSVLSLGAEIEECDGTDTISQAVDEMSNQGVTVTVAAGNTGPEEQTITIPGCSNEGITVGSVDKSDEIASYSSRGSTSDGRIKPDIVAPGTGIQSTYNNDGFTTLSGTSMATPHVAGQAALLLQEDQELTPSEIKNLIQQSSEDLGLEENTQGSGRINVNASYRLIADIEQDEEVEDTNETEQETDEEEEETSEDDTTDSEQERTGEMPQQAAEQAQRRGFFGPDSRMYGLRIAMDRASMAVGLQTREQVMEKRAQEARQMQERSNTQAAERAIGEMRRTAGESENATREAEETLDRVMENAPEEAKEGLRNALRNVEENRQQAQQRQRGQEQAPQEQSQREQSEAQRETTQDRQGNQQPEQNQEQEGVQQNREQENQQEQTQRSHDENRQQEREQTSQDRGQNEQQQEQREQENQQQQEDTASQQSNQQQSEDQQDQPSQQQQQNNQQNQNETQESSQNSNQQSNQQQGNQQQSNNQNPVMQGYFYLADIIN